MAAPTRFIFLRKLPNRLDPEEIRVAAEPFGVVANVLAFHQRGSALVEFDCLAAAERMMEAAGGEQPATPIRIADRIAQLDYGKEREPLARDPMEDRRILKECERCVRDLIKLLVKTEAEENRQARRLRRRKHQLLLSEMEQQRRRFGVTVPGDICMEFTVRGGSCLRGTECQLRHEIVPLACVPLRLRAFVMEDSFPELQELAAVKAQVNQELVSLSAWLPNRRALVLDGPGCKTVQALRACPTQRREAVDIVVPNNCSTSYRRIAEAARCTAHYGSLRSYLETLVYREELAAKQDASFGLIYLDYCSRLYAGKFHVEKCPTADLRLLMSCGAVDPAGCVLAVTLASEEAGSCADAPQHLRHFVARLTALAGLVSLPHPVRFEYEGNFVEIFFVAAPSSPQLAEYLALPTVRDVGNVNVWNTAE
eukprot:jgi/Tetstr1/445789/TSEL_033436.t2